MTRLSQFSRELVIRQDSLVTIGLLDLQSAGEDLVPLLCPEKPLFEKTWKLPDIEQVNRLDTRKRTAHPHVG
jgi:hypothetical protein